MTEQEFWDRAYPADDCDCIYHRNVKNNYRSQYKAVTINGRLYAAHRYAYISKVGPIPDGMCVLHNCDNAFCINPDHLRIGTPADNVADKMKRGRFVYGKRSHRPTPEVAQ